MKRNLFIVTIIIISLLIPGCMNKSKNIEASGNVEATEINIAAKVSGIVEKMAKEGDRVNKDDVIVELDREELEDQRDQAEAALKAAKIQLAKAEKALELQEAQTQNQVELSVAALGASEAQLNQSVSGAELQFAQTDSQIDQAQVKVLQSLEVYKQAREALTLQITDTETKIIQHSLHITRQNRSSILC